MQRFVKSIKTGDYELLDSGIVQVLNSQTTEIVFDDVSLQFKFTEDRANSNPGIKYNIISDKSVEFLINNVDTLVYGTTDFFKFATLDDGKDAFLSFRVITINDKNIRSLEYSFFKK